MAFVALVLVHPVQAMHCRSTHTAWWRMPSSPLSWLALVTLAAVQWFAVSWSPLAALLGSVPLALHDWMVALVAVAWPVALLEMVKGRSRPRGQP
jgi:hypothetical protein